MTILDYITEYTARLDALMSKTLNPAVYNGLSQAFELAKKLQKDFTFLTQKEITKTKNKHRAGDEVQPIVEYD